MFVYLRQEGLAGSVFEYAIPEQFFTDPSTCNAPGTPTPDPKKPDCAQGVSAVKAIAVAASQGQKIFTITSANAAVALPKLSHSASVMDEIRNALATGKEVTISEKRVTVSGWTGSGYVIVDPNTGTGAYILESANGGILASSCEKASEPLVRSISDQIKTFMVMALLASLLVAGIAGSGGTGAPAIPAGAAALQEAMAAVGVTTLVWSATSAAAGKCEVSKLNGCHRGRFQAQGGKGDLYAEESVKWEQAAPLTKLLAYSLLDLLKTKLTRRQLEARATGFAQIEKIVQSQGPDGVCAPFQRSRPLPALPDGIRVDVDVFAGQAFTN